jgi:hypothetical protein
MGKGSGGYGKTESGFVLNACHGGLDIQCCLGNVCKIGDPGCGARPGGGGDGGVDDSYVPCEHVPPGTVGCTTLVTTTTTTTMKTTVTTKKTAVTTKKTTVSTKTTTVSTVTTGDKTVPDLPCGGTLVFVKPPAKSAWLKQMTFSLRDEDVDPTRVNRCHGGNNALMPCPGYVTILLPRISRLRPST